MLVQTLRYLSDSSAHANVSSLGYTFLGGWAKNPILRQNTVPLGTERPPAVGRTSRARDGSFTHTHGVMHLLPTGVKKVNCGMAWFLRKPCFLLPIYQRVKR